MKKTMFNDKYGLTEAVLSGRKTQTRRVYKTPRNSYGGLEVENNCIITFDANGNEIVTRPKYEVGEVVAVAQSYKDAGYNPDKPLQDADGVGFYREAKLARGWNNKMFVQSALMPHQIRITNVRVERLQDISDEDCEAEGIRTVEVSNNWGNSASHWEFQVYYEDHFGRTKLLRGLTPQEAYAALIDRISGKGTWESNPYVFVYEFELVKCDESNSKSHG